MFIFLSLVLFLVFPSGLDDLCGHMGDLFHERRRRLGYIESILVPIELAQNGAMLEHQDSLLPLPRVF